MTDRTANDHTNSHEATDHKNEEAALDESTVRAWLEHVPDPEIPVLSVVELGIIQRIECSANEIVVCITPTYSGCPALETMKNDILTELRRRTQRPARVEVSLAPRWSTSRIPPSGLEKLRRYGIAPPVAEDTHEQLVQLGGRSTAPFPSKPQQLSCPRCGSTATSVIAPFGSTPCKSLYHCTGCNQPFEYFKPH